MESIQMVKHLIMVETDENHNKFYHMVHIKGENSFLVEYGRIGAKAMKRRYPLSLWDKKYCEKIQKGYKDQTEMVSVNVVPTCSNGSFAAIQNPVVNKFIERLLLWAGEHVKKNYSISVSAVSQRMVKEAQIIINGLKYVSDISSFNRKLNLLFTTLPRKMTNVSDYLCKKMEDIPEIIDHEQKLLDIMATEVETNIIKNSNTLDKNILEASGIEMRPVTDEELTEIKKYLGSSACRITQAFYVRNKQTEERFRKYCEERHIKKTKCLYHGSMNENFWNILKTGLLLHSGAATSGKMFGYGLYFASEPRKSMRYSSLNGCNNLHLNTTNTGLLAVFRVATGKEKNISVWSPEMSNYTEQTMNKFGTDSVFAHKGASLINDEMIVYNSSACTIRYLIEIA